MSAPRAPVLAICADGWDPAYVDDALDRCADAAAAEALDGGGTYAHRPRPGADLHQPQQRRDRHRRVSAAANGIAGNHYRDAGGDEVQVTDPGFLRATTIHAAALAGGRRRPLRDGQGQAARGCSPPAACPRSAPSWPTSRRSPDGTPVIEVLGRPNPGHLRLASSRRTRSTSPWRWPRGWRDARVRVADRLRPASRGAGRAAGRRVLPRDRRARSGARSTPASSSGSPPTTACAQSRAPTAAPNVRFLDEALDAAGVRSGHTLCPITDPYVVAPRRARLAGLGPPRRPGRARPRARRARRAGRASRPCSTARAAARGVRAPRRPDRRPDRARRRRAPCSGARPPPTTLARCTARCARTAGCTSAASRSSSASRLRRGCDCAGRELRNRDLHDLLLNHARHELRAGRASTVRSPYSGELVGEAPVSGPAEVRALLDAGAAAGTELLPRHERSQILFAVAELLAAAPRRARPS